MAREVKSLVTTGYCLPGEVLILCRSLARQGATLSRACAQLGVPVQVRPYRSLLQVPVVTALLKALRVATEDWPRTLVGDVLASPYFRLKGRGPEAEVDVEGIASEAFIVGGRETWFDRLRRLEEGLTAEAGEGAEDAEEAPEVSQRRRKRAAERAQACRPRPREGRGVSGGPRASLRGRAGARGAGAGVCDLCPEAHRRP